MLNREKTLADALQRELSVLDFDSKVEDIVVLNIFRPPYIHSKDEDIFISDILTSRRV